MQFKNDFFLVSYLLVLIILIPFQLIFNQTEISLFVNSHFSPFVDQICKYGTYLGDGFFVVFLCLAIFKFNPKLASAILFAYLISAGFTQMLKLLFFTQSLRPLSVIPNLDNIHLVPGIDMNYYNSFPSGHSTSAFALFAIISFFFKSKPVKLLCLLLAIFTAYTRIYLFQHFLIDTIAGSLIGTITAILTYNYLIHMKGFESLVSKFFKHD